MASKKLLEIVGLNKRFGGVAALDKVLFDVEEGEVHGLVGENGAGKSTLIKILAGVHTKDEGQIWMEGKETNIDNPQKAASLGLNFIHQELYQVPYFSIAESLWFGRKYPRNKLGLIDWKTVKKKAREELSKFGIPDGFENELISRTSMAYRYICAIAKAISQHCRILFMDEPSASLTKDETGVLFEIIGELKKRGISIVYISHRLEEIFQICDRVTILRDGKLVGTHRIDETDIEQVIYGMLGEELRERFPKTKIEKGDECLVVSELESELVPKTSFKLHRGEILGLIGLVGSGRTELLRLIFGADIRTGGRMYINGKEVRINSIRNAVRNGISLVPEDRHTEGIILNIPIKENMTLANLYNYCLGRIGLINLRKEAIAANNYVKKLRIKAESINTRAMYLSGGNQQKVVISKWIDTKANILIFDESTRGIDVGSKTEVYLLIQEFAKNGAGVIFSTSEIEEVLGLTDRFFVLHKGKIVKEYWPEEVTSDQVALAMQVGGNGNGKDQRTVN